MAIRLERSGELMLIRGNPDEPEKPKGKKSIETGLWLALIALVGAMLVASLDVLAWPAISGIIKSFLAAIW